MYRTRQLTTVLFDRIESVWWHDRLSSPWVVNWSFRIVRNLEPVFFSISRCNQHSVLDVSVYDNNAIAVLLQEEVGDNVPVLALLALSSVSDDKYINIPSESL